VPGNVGQDRLAAGLVKIGLPGNVGLPAVTRGALPGKIGLPTCAPGFPHSIRRNAARRVCAGQKIGMPPGKRRASSPLPRQSHLLDSGIPVFRFR